MKCSKCGKETTAGQAYCGACGNSLGTMNSDPVSNNSPAEGGPNSPAKAPLLSRAHLPVFAAAIVLLILLGIVVLLLSRGSSTKRLDQVGSAGRKALSGYEQSCSSGGTSSGDGYWSGTIQGVAKSVVCNNGDAGPGYSGLIVFQNDSYVQGALQVLGNDQNGSTCFLSGPSWILIVPGATGFTSAQDEAQTEQSYMGGDIIGTCSSE